VSDFKAKNWNKTIYLGWALPQLRWGSFQHSPGPLAGFKGSTSKGKWEGRIEWEGEGIAPPLSEILNTPLVCSHST